MSSTHPMPAHGLEPDTGRTPPFASETSSLSYLAAARERATAGRHDGLASRDFDALDWLRFWLPQSDWHTRRVRTAGRRG